MASILNLPEPIKAHLPLNNVTCDAVLTKVHTILTTPIFNHSLRVYLLAKHLSEKENTPYHQTTHLLLLFLACICHDLGACHESSPHSRFEVDGADQAVELCQEHGLNDEKNLHQIWTAIALHTSAGIAERIDPFTRLVRMAVKCDFSAAHREMHGMEVYSKSIEECLPRLNIEKVLADAVVAQASPEVVSVMKDLDSMNWPDSAKHPKASWPGILLRAAIENPGFEGVNPAF